MTQFSLFWTTSGAPAGHQVASYTQVHASTAFEILAAAAGHEGVAPGYLNQLVGSVPAPNAVRIGTGGAVADGKIYKNDVPVDIVIPSAVGAGNTRIDRIVLRVDWAAFTAVLTRIAGTDAASPTAPAVTQNSGVTYDLMLYQARVTTAGTVTLTDEREFAQVPTDGIANGAVTNPKLRDGAALSVMGRAGNTAGPVADIVAANDGYVLRRNIGGDALVFAQIVQQSIADSAVVEAKIGAGAVTETKLGAGAVTNAKLGAAAVDDVKVGNRVPRLRYRQGGDANDWTVDGTTDYLLAKMQMVFGVISDTLPAGPGQDPITITFPPGVVFTAPPFVLPVLINAPSYAYLSGVGSTALDATVVVSRTVTTNVDTFYISWIAIGPTA